MPLAARADAVPAVNGIHVRLGRGWFAAARPAVAVAGGLDGEHGSARTRAPGQVDDSRKGGPGHHRAAPNHRFTIGGITQCFSRRSHVGSRFCAGCWRFCSRRWSSRLRRIAFDRRAAAPRRPTVNGPANPDRSRSVAVAPQLGQLAEVPAATWASKPSPQSGHLKSYRGMPCSIIADEIRTNEPSCLLTPLREVTHTRSWRRAGGPVLRGRPCVRCRLDARPTREEAHR